MYTVPDVDEVLAVAKQLGIHLGPEEATLYRKYLLEQMSELDRFVQARLEESTPRMVSAARSPGHRPTHDEDPLNAWTWTGARSAANSETRRSGMCGGR